LVHRAATAIENINAARPIVEPAATDRTLRRENRHVLTVSLQAASLPVDNVNTKQAQNLAKELRESGNPNVRRAYLFCQILIDRRPMRHVRSLWNTERHSQSSRHSDFRRAIATIIRALHAPPF